MTFLFAILVFFIALFLIMKFAISMYLDTRIPLTQSQLFTIPAGSNSKTLSSLLNKNNIIDKTDATVLPYIIRLLPNYHQFKAGTFELTPAMTYDDLLTLFVSGKEAQFSIKFIEGNTFAKWREILNTAPYIKHTITSLSDSEIAQKLDIKQTNPEGWFYPDSYHYTANTTDLALLERAHNRMKTFLNQEWQSRDQNLPYISSYDMLIMASIIEKETSRDDERNLVASVFVNRLKKGMRLQTDPTVIYGMGDKYKGNITRRDLTTSTPYNTYIITGLPPTPIAMPSLASLKAAAHPAESSYLFFVADGNGRHVFSKDLTSHNNAVQNYLRILKAKKQSTEN